MEAGVHLPVSVGAVRGFLKGGGEGEFFFFLWFFLGSLGFGIWSLEFWGGFFGGGVGGDGVFHGPFTILSGSLGVRHRFRIGYCINCTYQPHISCPPESPQQPLLHLHLVLFALQTFLTTAVCIVEYHSWPELSAGERSALGGLYVPYLGFGEFLCFLFFCFLKWL